MMVYFIYAAVAVIGSILVMLSMHLFGVADIEFFNKLKIKSNVALREENSDSSDNKENEDTSTDETEEEKKPEEDECASVSEEKTIKPYSKGFCIAAFILSIAAMFGIEMVLDHYVFYGEITATGCFNFAKLFVVFVITAACALIDFKKRIIPNKIVITGLIFRAAVYIGEIILCRDLIKDIALNDLIGFGIGFGILFVAGLLSKGAIGFGDAKLFAVIGLCAGSLCTFGTLLFSLFCSAIVGIVLLIKYRDKKRAFPFGPSIFIGYTLVLLMGNF